MNITEFLEARIAEDEKLAQAAIDQHAPEEWESELGSMNLWPEDIAFWAQQTPPRVLSECAAKRLIIELHDALEDKGWQSGKDHDYLWCGSCGTLDDAPVPYPCETLEALAATYKDHPDYQQEWA